MNPSAPVTRALTEGAELRRRRIARSARHSHPRRVIARASPRRARRRRRAPRRTGGPRPPRQQRGQRLDDVHAVARDLMKDRWSLNSGTGAAARQAGLGALDRVEQDGRRRPRAVPARSPTSARARGRRARLVAVEQRRVSSSSRPPIRWARATKPSRSITRSVASPAAAAKSLPPNVEPCLSPAPSRRRRGRTRSRDQNPADRDEAARQRLGDADHVGVQTQCSSARNGRCAQARSGPRRRRTARRTRGTAVGPLQKTVGGDVTPLPWTGSTIARRRRRATSRSARRGRRTCTASQPGMNGPKPSRKFSSPLSDSEPSVRPGRRGRRRGCATGRSRRAPA